MGRRKVLTDALDLSVRGCRFSRFLSVLDIDGEDPRLLPRRNWCLCVFIHILLIHALALLSLGRFLSFLIDIHPLCYPVLVLSCQELSS